MIASSDQQIVNLSDQAIRPDDVLSAIHHTTLQVSVHIQNCTSHDWQQVGVALTSLDSLRSLTLRSCDVGDAFFVALSAHSSLLSLSIGTYTNDGASCSVSNSSVNSISTINQLEELEIGTEGEMLDNNTEVTLSAYCNVLSIRNLKRLVFAPPITTISFCKTALT